VSGVGARVERPAFTLAALRELAEQLPEGAALTLPRATLLEALAGVPVRPPATPAGELTVADIASHFQRSSSTVRDWIRAGRFSGAFRLNGRDWRVPQAALLAFSEAQRQRGKSTLGAWRRARRAS